MNLILQQPLPIHQISGKTLENFYSEDNALLLDSLYQNFAQVSQPFFYIWGSKSSGKSHLLKAACEYFLTQARTTGYFPLAEFCDFSADVSDDLLKNAAQLDLICLDDLQQIVGKPEWEKAVFDLFNQIREQQSGVNPHRTLLLITADQPPNSLALCLPDLASRLNWGEVYRLNEPNDQQKCTILQRYAHAKGLELSDEVANFLLKRLARDLQILIEKLDLLDHASLQAQRKLTLPFVKSVLGL